MAKKILRFEKGPGFKKYTAVLVDGNGNTSRVSFGDRRYWHYRDRVPVRLGGGLWRHKDHGDAKRRANYRKRHGGIRRKDGSRATKAKFSPAWFSLNYLW